MLFSLIPLVVWLRPLHHCSMFRLDVAGFSGDPTICFFSDSAGNVARSSRGGSIEVNWIFGSRERTICGKQGQLPSEIVETRSQEMCYLADFNAPLWMSGHRTSNSKAEDNMSSVRIIFDQKPIGFSFLAERGESRFEIFNFGMSSQKLKMCASQWVQGWYSILKNGSDGKRLLPFGG